MNCRRSSPTLDWDQLFGASTFAYKNIRRKADARAYPSRLEFGLKGGIVPPDRAQQRRVRRAAARPHRGALLRHEGLRRPADAVPNGGRRSAVSAAGRHATAGSLADAMRATMSLPLIFPPMEVNGQVLIDGGTMDNVPADVVKAMGADPRDRRQRRRSRPIARA